MQAEAVERRAELEGWQADALSPADRSGVIGTLLELMHGYGLSAVRGFTFSHVASCVWDHVQADAPLVNAVRSIGMIYSLGDWV
jgi:hypothetical protein